VATKKTKKGARKARQTKKGAARRPAKRTAKPSRKAKKAKKAKKPAKKPAKKARAKPKKGTRKSSKPARKSSKPARKPTKSKARTKAKSAKKPRAAARSAPHSNRPVTSATQGRPRLAAPGKTPKASIRRPEGAEELKAKIGALASATSQIRALKRTLNKSFYEIGQILRKIEIERLYEVKGYGSFEAFVEREIDLGKNLSLKIVRIVQVFLREAALAAGVERLSAALDALDGEEPEAAPGSPSATSSGTRSAIPLHKQ
jgi:hypothetical protein